MCQKNKIGQILSISALLNNELRVVRKENHFLSSNGFGVAIGMEALLSYNDSSLGLRKGVTRA